LIQERLISLYRESVAVTSYKKT